MEEKRPEERWSRFSQVVAISVALHLVIAAAFIVRLPTQAQPQPEDAVNVDLVPPPEEKQPDKQEAQKQPEQEKKAEKAPEPPPPPPPAQQPEKSEGQPPPAAPQEKAEKPPEPPKPPEKAPEPPKPPEPKPPEAPKEAKAEPPKAPEKAPEPPKPPESPKEEAKAESPPKPEEKQPDPPPPPKQDEAQKEASPPMPTMRPVLQFGDKDGGPRKSLDGDSADDSADSNADATDQTAGGDSGNPPASADDTAKPDELAQSASQVAKDINLPQVGAQDIHSQNDGPASEGDGSAKTSFSTEKKPDAPKSSQGSTKPGTKSADTADGHPSAEPKLKQAKKLYSTQATSDLSAMVAMAGIPRTARFKQLCQSELFGQLANGSPRYQPKIATMPSRATGNVMTLPAGAFLDVRGWYDVSFRCEVNDDATKVVSFSISVGSAIPRSEWRQRGFPEF